MATRGPSILYKVTVKRKKYKDKKGNKESKGKVAPLHAMKACRGSRSIAPFILNLGVKWR
jgi:hypothetical protein